MLPAHGSVLCADCGAEMPPTSSGLCASCLSKEVSFDDVVASADLISCTECGRYLPHKRAIKSSSAQRTTAWLDIEPESAELMALCLKNVSGVGKGRTKAQLKDARFVWTEPHSRRVKVRMLLEKSVESHNTCVRREVEVEFKERTRQCPKCARSKTGKDWQACVQLRQRVEHKRTFLKLEQMLIKDSAKNWIRTDDSPPDGVDFYFESVSSASGFVKFVSARVPVGNRKDSKALISHDSRNATANETRSVYLEILPVCKHDVLMLPPSLHLRVFGTAKIEPVVCASVASTVTLVCGNRVATLQSDKRLWKSGEVSEMRILKSVSRLEAFVVSDCQIVDGAVELDVLGDEYSVLVSQRKDALETIDGSWKLPVEAGHTLLGYRLADDEDGSEYIVPVRITRSS